MVTGSSLAACVATHTGVRAWLVANAMGKPSVLREPKGARKGREGAQSGVIKRGGNSITWEVDQPF